MTLVTSELLKEPNLLDEPAKEPEPEDAVQSRRTLMRAASQRRSLRLREQTLPGAGSSRNLEAPAELAAPALLPPPVSQGSMGRQDTFVDEHLASRASYGGGSKGRPPRPPGSTLSGQDHPFLHDEQ